MELDLNNDDFSRGEALVRSICNKYSIQADITNNVSARLRAVLSCREAPVLPLDIQQRSRGEDFRVWVACVLYIEVALVENNLRRRGKRSKQQRVNINCENLGLGLLQLLESTEVTMPELCENLKTAMETSARLGVSSPRTRAWTQSAAGFDGEDGSKERRRAALDGGVKLIASEQQVLREVKVLRITLMTMSMLFQKFTDLWNSASNAMDCKRSATPEVFFQKSPLLLRRRSSLSLPASDSVVAKEIAWLFFVLAQQELEKDEEDGEVNNSACDGKSMQLAWSYKLLVAVVYLTRIATHSHAKGDRVSPTLAEKQEQEQELGQGQTQEGKKDAQFNLPTGVEGQENKRDTPTPKKRGIIDNKLSGHRSKRIRHLVESPQKLLSPPRLLDGTPRSLFSSEEDDQDSTMMEPESHNEAEFFRKTMVSASDVHELAETVKAVLAELVAKGVFGGKKDVGELLCLAGLCSDATRAAASHYYAEKYLTSVASFDKRCLLDRGKGLKFQAMHTPMKPLAGLSITNGSLEHKLSKQSLESNSSNILKKSLFISPSPTRQSPSPLPRAGAGTGGSGCASRSRSASLDGEHLTPPLRPSVAGPAGTPGMPSFSLGGGRGVSGTGTASSESPRPFASPIRSLGRNPMPMYTPVSGALDASNWLSRELDGAPTSASNRLQRFFTECDVNPSGEIVKRLEQMRQALQSAYQARRRNSKITTALFSEMSEAVASRRARGSPSPSLGGLESYVGFGTKLYFLVLESIVLGESSRLGTRKFDSLLQSDMFHRSLFACCMEVIFRWKEAFRLMYPALIDCLDVPAFELLKVVGSFLKYVRTLPKLLERHLKHIETNILEQAAWARRSPVFDLLSKRRQLIADQKQPESSDKLASAREERLALHEKQQVHLLPLDMFLRKMLGVANERMKSLYSGLGFPLVGESSFYKDIWDVFRASINEKPELVMDRHIDHIILCSVYAVSKLRKSKPIVTFKALLIEYRKVTKTEENRDNYDRIVSNMSRGGDSDRFERIAHEIVLNETGKKGDLIKYYNEVFVPKMKLNILNLRTKPMPGLLVPTLSSSSTACTSSSSAPFSTAPFPATTSPKNVSAPKDSMSYRSPARSDLPPRSTRRVDMTPRTKQLFAPSEHSESTSSRSPTQPLSPGSFPIASKLSTSESHRGSNMLKASDNLRNLMDSGMGSGPGRSRQGFVRTSSRARIHNLLHRTQQQRIQQEQQRLAQQQQEQQQQQQELP